MPLTSLNTIKLGKPLAQFKQELISFQQILSDKYYPSPDSKLTNSKLQPPNNNKKCYSRNSTTKKNIMASPVMQNLGRWKPNKPLKAVKDFVTSPRSLKNSRDIALFFTAINKEQLEKKLAIKKIAHDYTPVERKTSPLTYSTRNLNLNSKPLLQSANYTTNTSCCDSGRDFYHPETECAMNQQILAELNASYAYLSLACYFGRTNVALPGCYGFFMNMYEEEQQHALIFINYQNLRGGRVELYPVCLPQGFCIDSIPKAFATAESMEKEVKHKLINLHQIADKHNDYSVTDLVDGEFITEQDRSICEMARLCVRAVKMGESGIGEYLFDKEVHEAFVKRKQKKADKAGQEDTSVYK